MKSLFLLAAATLVGFAAMAQPVVSPEYYGRIGNRFSYRDVTADTALFKSVGTGPGQTWSYQTLRQGSPINGRLVETATGAVRAQFPSSNMLMKLNGGFGDLEYYFENNMQGSHLVGFHYGGTTTRFTPGIKLLLPGMTAGQAFTQTILERTVDIGATDTTYKLLTEQVSYAGSGTVLLPGGAAFTEVVLMVLQTKDFAGQGPAGPFTLTDSATRYNWYAPGVGYPILEYGIITEIGSSPYRYASYLANVVVGLAPKVAFQPLHLSPVPAASRVRIGLPADETATVASVLDMAGRPVATLPLADGHLQVGALPPGAYIVEVRGRKTYRARLIRE